MIISNSCQTSFQGDNTTKILNNFDKISSLDELTNLPEFKDKILYINLYSFYCKHSKEEFPYLIRLQNSVQGSSKLQDVAFIHLSTSKLAFEGFWRTNVEDSDLPGYHFLMNEEFENDVWSHFPKERRATPFFIEVTKDKRILKTDRPSTILQGASLNNFKLQTFKFIRANLDSVLSQHTKNYDLLFKFDKFSEEKISFLTYSKNNPDDSKGVDVWKNLKVFAEKSFDSIPDKDGLSGYSFAIPLNVETLDSIILR